MSLDVQNAALVTELAELATSRPDPVRMQRLGRRVRRDKSRQQDGTALRVRLVSSFLTDMLADALAAALARRGIWPQLDLAPFGSLPIELISAPVPSDVLILLPTHRDLSRHVPIGSDAASADTAALAEAQFWSRLWPAGQPIVQLTFDPPATRQLGEVDGLTPGGQLFHARAVNRHLAALAPPNVALVDAEALAASVGPAWHCARTYALCKQPFTGKAAAELAEALAAAATSLLGKARKVLVLDLDNTLWGGVIGDVGVDGITLGMESAEGEAFVQMQRYAQTLSRRGVIIAICSKNADEIARAAFGSHSAMVLTMDDIACFVANFDDKATNIRKIAATLNVGLDSLVFVDDNPIERAWVKSQLPEVLVVDMPEDPAGYVQAIENSRCFPMHRLTQEDVTRTSSYRKRAEHIEAASVAVDMDAFLKGLLPVATWSPLRTDNGDRIVQLIGKTNQFKVTPRIYSIDDLRTRGVTAVSLRDTMQDYGIVAVAVTSVDGNDLLIEQWVMSCRVFGRRLEHATLEVLRGMALAQECTRLIIEFERSQKNLVALEYLLALGFQDLSGNLVIDVGQNLPIDHHMSIVERNNDD